ncbi:MAG TPA: hypothetical protein VN642_10605 [Dongiaceae bacterium]|nr:hypothetical protein [Dongiaceae bacterium]
MGGDVTLSTARLTASVLLAIVMIFVYLTVRKHGGRLQAALFTVPLIIFYGLTDYFDFNHYSSELLPLALLLLASYCVVCIFLTEKPREPGLLLVSLLGLSLGAIPFSKLQAAPIACAIGLFASFLLFSVNSACRLRTVSLFLATLVVPSMVLLLPLAISGNLVHFFNSYIAWAFIYIQKRLTLGELHQLIKMDAFFRTVIYFEGAAGLLSLAFWLFQPPKRGDARLTIFFLAVLAASAYAVVRPGNRFPHYLMFLLPFAVLTSASLVRVQMLKNRRKIAFTVLYGITALLLLSPAVSRQAKNKMLTYRYWSLNPIPFGFSWTNPNVFAWAAKPSDRLLIWGWMPQWYLMGGLVPATRETHTNAQIVQTRLTEYFRDRLFDDLTQSRPEIIIDSVAGESFSFNDPLAQGISTFPRLSQLLSDDFEILGQKRAPDASCPRYYISKQRAAELRSNLVAFKTIIDESSSPPMVNAPSLMKLDDGIVTEDTCVDYWIPSNGRLGQLSFVFQRAEPVRKVMILNTANGMRLDHATDRLKLTLYNGNRVVGLQELAISPHPRWTEYVLESPCIADSMKVELLSFYGIGAGLNEVKVYKAF